MIDGKAKDDQESTNLHRACTLRMEAGGLKALKEFQKDHRWWIDSGADVHICHNKKLFNEGFFKTASQSVIGIKDNILHIEGIGSVNIQCEIDGKLMPLTLTNVCYAPESEYNLFSVETADKKGFEFSFKDGKVKGYAPTGELLFISGTRQGSSQTYAIDLATPKAMKVDKNNLSWNTWHRRLAHLNICEKASENERRHRYSKGKCNGIGGITPASVWIMHDRETA